MAQNIETIAVSTVKRVKINFRETRSETLTDNDGYYDDPDNAHDDHHL